MLEYEDFVQRLLRTVNSSKNLLKVVWNNLVELKWINFKLEMSRNLVVFLPMVNELTEQMVMVKFFLKYLIIQDS